MKVTIHRPFLTVTHVYLRLSGDIMAFLTKEELFSVCDTLIEQKKSMKGAVLKNCGMLVM